MHVELSITQFINFQQQFSSFIQGGTKVAKYVIYTVCGFKGLYGLRFLRVVISARMIPIVIEQLLQHQLS